MQPIAKEAIPPFWHRIPKFFLVPTEAPVLWRIGLFALMVPVSYWLKDLGPPGWAAMLVLWLVALGIGAQYGFRIIEETARGFLRPSLYQQQFGERVISLLPYKYIGLYAIYGAIAVGVGWALGRSEIVALLTWFALMAIVLPAATMRLTTTGSLRFALSPAEIGFAINRIGAPYFGLSLLTFVADLCRMTGILVIAGVGGVSLSKLSGGFVSGWVAVVVLVLIGVAFWYFTYVICTLNGYAMYQYAKALNISVVGRGELQRSGTLSRKIDMKKRTRDSIVDTLATTGDVRDAIELVSDDLRGRPNDLALHARLHKLLLQEGSTPRIEAHTERYLDLLMASDNAREALPLVEEAFGRNAQWQPRKLEHIVPLARAALGAGKYPLVASLIRGFDKKHRAHPEIPNVYLIAAQMLMQTEGPNDQVRQILDLLAGSFAQHPAGMEAKRMRDRLSQLTVGNTPAGMARRPA
jgi:hypothetical protein